jgi:hypothetical protein
MVSIGIDLAAPCVVAMTFGIEGHVHFLERNIYDASGISGWSSRHAGCLYGVPCSRLAPAGAAQLS